MRPFPTNRSYADGLSSSSNNIDHIRFTRLLGTRQCCWARSHPLEAWCVGWEPGYLPDYIRHIPGTQNHAGLCCRFHRSNLRVDMFDSQYFSVGRSLLHRKLFVPYPHYWRRFGQTCSFPSYATKSVLSQMSALLAFILNLENSRMW